MGTGSSRDFDSFSAFGDSITVGFYASNQATTAWIPLLADLRDWTVTNYAVGGQTVITQAGAIYTGTILRDSISTIMLGTNDELSMTTANQRTDWDKIEIIQIAYRAIANNKKIFGTDTTKVFYTGSWSNTIQFGLGKNTTELNATATFQVFGESIIMGFIGNDITQGNTAEFSITVDGIDKGTYPISFLTALPGLVYAPFGVIVDGLSKSLHTVEIRKTTSSGRIWFDWAAGIDKDDIIRPYVYVANIIYQTAAGYAVNGGSDANIDAFNIIIADNVNYLNELGLNVYLVDLNTTLNITTDLYTDGIHPDDDGHLKIANKFNSIINPVSLLPPVKKIISISGRLLK